MSYTLGDADMTDASYANTQSPSCGYTETVTVTNLPSFATHNSGAQDFTIQKFDDRSKVGTYTVTITHTIQEPTDYTKTAFIEHKIEYDFTIEILDPCETTTINAMTINNMQAEVDGSAAVQALAAPTDSVAYANGD